MTNTNRTEAFNCLFLARWELKDYGFKRIIMKDYVKEVLTKAKNCRITSGFKLP